MFASLFNLLVIASLTVSTYGLGRPLLRRFRLGTPDPLSIGVYSIGFGLVAVNAILLGLGLIGWLNEPVLIVLTTLGCCWGIFEIGRAWMQASTLSSTDVVQEVPFEVFTAATQPRSLPSRWLALGMTLVVLLILASTLMRALTPPISEDVRGLQLNGPKMILLQHGILGDAQHCFAIAASPVDLWCLWAMALGGETCAQVFCWSFSILLMASVVLLASPVLGRPWAWVAGAVSLTSPCLSQQMIALPDTVALAVFCTLAAATWWQATVHGEDEPWIWAAGVFAGAAIAIHWVAAGWFLATLTASWAWMFWRQLDQRHFLLRGGSIMACVAVAIGCLCCPPSSMASNTVRHGNVSLWGHAEVLDFLGLLILAAVPGLFFTRRLRGFGPVACVAVGCVLLGCLFHENRLLSVAVPPACIAAVWAWMEMRRYPRPVLQVVAVAFVVIAATIVMTPLVHSYDAVRIALGFEDRENYLLEHEPTYRAAVVANEMLASDAHILSQDANTLYFNRPVMFEEAFHQRIGGNRRDIGIDEYARCVREAGFTHLLLADAVGVETSASRTMWRPLDDNHLLDDYLFHKSDGTVCRYRLISLK
jgi:hypothetical protein